MQQTGTSVCLCICKYPKLSSFWIAEQSAALLNVLISWFCIRLTNCLAEKESRFIPGLFLWLSYLDCGVFWAGKAGRRGGASPPTPSPEERGLVSYSLKYLWIILVSRIKHPVSPPSLKLRRAGRLPTNSTQSLLFHHPIQPAKHRKTHYGSYHQQPKI